MRSQKIPNLVKLRGSIRVDILGLSSKFWMIPTILREVTRSWLKFSTSQNGITYSYFTTFWALQGVWNDFVFAQPSRMLPTDLRMRRRKLLNDFNWGPFDSSLGVWRCKSICRKQPLRRIFNSLVKLGKKKKKKIRTSCSDSAHLISDGYQNSRLLIWKY